MSTALGIDLSTTTTGLVILKSNGTKVPGLVLEKQVAFKKLKGLENVQAIVTDIMTTIHEHKPDAISIEAFSLNMRNASSVIPLVGAGSILRFMMYLDGLAWYAPSAGELKSFVTGKGNDPKDMVNAWVLKKWGHMAKDNNTADAYGLACMALATRGELPGITGNMKALATKQMLFTDMLHKPKEKKPRV